MGQIRSLAFALGVLAGCSTAVIPERPLTLVCPEKELIVGIVVEETVIMPYDAAIALQQWIDGTMICKDSNILGLTEHIEALEKLIR